MTRSRVAVPSAVIGRVEVPRLFLGDNGYLAKLASAMTGDEVAGSMARMLAKAEVGLSAGERRVVDAAITARHGHGSGAPLMIHGDLVVSLRGTKVRYRHCAATLTRELTGHGLDLRTDPVLGFLHRVGADGIPLDAEPPGDLALDEEALGSLADDVRRAGPVLLTVGGDWLDLLLLLGRKDLVADGLGRLKDVARSVDTALVLTTYVGAVADSACVSDAIGMVDGVMVPLNHSGAAMLPDPVAHLDWVRRLGPPVIGMHVLAGGHDPRAALGWLDLPGVAAVVIGASSDDHQDALVRAAEEHFSRVSS